MKIVLAATFAFCVSVSLAGQPAPASSPVTDLAAVLTDAEHSVTATNADLANLNIEKMAAGWKTGIVKKNSHKKDPEQAADSVKRLAGTLPEMITAVRTAHGSVGSSFKLYNGLTQTCEHLETLVHATQAYGRKDEYTRLSADYNNMLHIRNSLAVYVEQRAALMHPGSVTSVPVKAPTRGSTGSYHGRKTATVRTTASKKKVVLRSSR